MAHHFLACIIFVSLVSARTTLYEWSYYHGQSIEIKDNVTDTSNISWHSSIQSFQIEPGEELVTFTEPHFQGNQATWHHSTVFTANWVNKIASVKIQPTNITLPTNDTTPWQFMGTHDGFAMVRLSAQLSATPECYSVDGVNCVTTSHIYELLPWLNATNVSIYPAKCDYQRKVYWGNKTDDLDDWCTKASNGLNSLGYAPWTAVSSPSGDCAVAISGQFCIREQNQCETFTTPEIAQVCASKLLWGARGTTQAYDEDSLLQCGHTETCSFSDAMKVGKTDSNRVYTATVIPLLVLFVTGWGLLVAYRYKKKQTQEDLEATYCSSCHEDDSDAHYESRRDVV
ncbi:hypothetical protein THRCLA_11596 [Thraustotheca clavata]|uniref:Beta/gamma crystallin 'Greek key' domain-containing protein n=1 Tax=Thraustotheca clavata TaxID=74557 RepID=A0A1V9Y783_9STRA|nr:hypothetical protein THRCLA_11596 [Thraustotheca clavata]